MIIGGSGLRRSRRWTCGRASLARGDRTGHLHAGTTARPTAATARRRPHRPPPPRPSFTPRKPLPIT